MVKVKISGICKTFDGVRAVNNVSFKVKDGEFVSLLGPSGCGKTTLLRMIAGVEQPDAGEIYFGDVCVNDVSPKDRNIAMVYQSYALYPNMTAKENIGFNLKLRKVPKKERNEQTVEICKTVGILGLLNRKPSQMSGGEQQRVALARALVRKPCVFLMDEPLSNLDAKLRASMRLEIRRIHKEVNVSTIYVTHDQLEAQAMSERTLLLRKGEVQQIGTPEELYNKPRNMFTADFIGSPAMNLLDCSLTEAEDRLELDVGFTTLSVPRALEDILRNQSRGSELKLGIRPEDVSPSEGKDADTFRAEIAAVELIGSNKYVYLMTSDRGESPMIVMVVPAFLNLQVGKTEEIIFDINHIHVFDKKSGLAIL